MKLPKRRKSTAVKRALSSKERQKEIYALVTKNMTSSLIKRWALAEGIRMLQKRAIPEIRKMIAKFIHPLVKNAYANTLYEKRTTMLPRDVAVSLRTMGQAVYGYDINFKNSLK